METILKGKILGINGLGRIGKLTLWYHLQANYFDGFVINIGRDIVKNLDDLLQVIETDSTYGTLSRFLFGFAKEQADIKIIDETVPVISVNGKKIKFLRKARNPKDINWANEGVRLVVDCTGSFLDPTSSSDNSKGSLRGHIEAGAEKVILSAPFKISDSAKKMPEDSAMFVYGINHYDFNHAQHNVISAASCTTTGLAHMMKPLLEDEFTSDIVTASMSTIHATTNTQSILDAVPKANASDLRKSRAVMNNIILSTTGAAKALEYVLPQIKNIGFMADSVRIPTSTVSLITLNITFHTGMNDKNEPVINRNYINNIYQKASNTSQNGLLVFSERQNVSTDLIGVPAACIIEGHETHTRTGFLKLSSSKLKLAGYNDNQDINMPVTHAKVFGWYDNELGSYVYCLGKLTSFVYQQMN